MNLDKKQYIFLISLQIKQKTYFTEALNILWSFSETKKPKFNSKNLTLPQPNLTKSLVNPT